MDVEVSVTGKVGDGFGVAMVTVGLIGVHATKASNNSNKEMEYLIALWSDISTSLGWNWLVQQESIALLKVLYTNDMMGRNL
jgi:hypothetical protein